MLSRRPFLLGVELLVDLPEDVCEGALEDLVKSSETPLGAEGAPVEVLAVEDRFREGLAESRRSDAVTGSTASGPHRSDLVVRHLESGMPAAQCSTGEQKALLIAIVLANARLQAEERATVPLLLLDEVTAHLDGRRRLALFEEVAALGAQAWFTGTDITLFAPLAEAAQFFHVENAQVQPMKKTDE